MTDTGETKKLPDGELPAGYEEYEGGKHRRYELMFKVNGAAFAIAGLVFKPDSKDLIECILGLRSLAIGMATFTFFMGIDIFAFGWKMKQLVPQSEKRQVRFATKVWSFTPIRKGLFGPIGMIVLTMIVGLRAIAFQNSASNWTM